MSVQRARYSATNSEYLAASALALARAGLEDARIKLERDQFFPPFAASDQHSFTYSEDVTLAGVPGSYFVAIDESFTADPFDVLLITSTGTIGTREAPLAQRSVYAELDQNPLGANGNFHSYWHYINFQDQSSL